MTKLVIVSGSPSHNSRLHGILGIAEQLLAAEGIDSRWIKLRDLPAEDLLYARFDSPRLEGALRAVEEADAVIIGTPIYKASYTGLLKAFLDILPQKGLERKVILPIAIGGSLAHLLAIDYALKPVLGALGARTIHHGVYAVDTHVKWKDGQMELSDEISGRLHEAVSQFAEELRYRSAAGAADVPGKAAIG